MSRIAGAVVTADGTLDGLGFGRCTVGGTDATDAVCALVDRIDREDVRHVACAGIAPAWFNCIDLHTLSETVDRPVYAVSYEDSPGLDAALRAAFDGEALATRREMYVELPPRVQVDTTDIAGNGELFVRAVGIEPARAAAAVRALVQEGFRRPEPLRIAALAASAHREAMAMRPDPSA